jgi:catechol 2,3-dioxygenase-like lactoylglutathione lyase family enzyme
MLSNSKLQSIIWTSRTAEAETFYRGVLGLILLARSDGALVFNVGGGEVRVSPVPSTAPSAHTVLGFSVDDVDSVIAFLGARGVVFERFDGFPHDDNGAVLTPDGARVAWFRDPDGNLLSVVQFPLTD